MPIPDPYPEPVSRRILTPGEVLGLIIPLWPPSEWQNALQVCHSESGYDTGARNTNGEDSRGLFQLNVVPAANPDLARWNLYDPQLNAYWAAQMFRARRWRPWYNTAVKLGLPLDW